MNAYFFKMTNEERDNILNQHKTIYDGYVTSYAQQPKEQPLYTQDFANDKEGLTVSNKGVVTAYKNMNINEMRYDHKSTGLFADEENGFKETMEQGHISGGSIYEPEESFESEDKDDEYYVSLGEHLDMIGDGDDDLEHGVFGDEDEEDMILISPEIDFDDDCGIIWICCPIRSPYRDRIVGAICKSTTTFDLIQGRWRVVAILLFPRCSLVHD